MSNNVVLTCRELVELVTDYAEGALSHEQHARFEEHLMICDGCRNYVDQMRRTILLTGTLTEEQISPEAERDLLEAFRDWKKGSA